MTIPWGLIAAAVIAGFAWLIRDVFDHIIEEQKIFLAIIVVFLVVYVGAAFVVGSFNPLVLTSSVTQAASN